MNPSGPSSGDKPSISELPSRESIVEHLEQVLKSSAFSGAARQQRLLRYLVEALLNGRASELKEYSLGVEVFDRGDEFDPRLDPIVRVEASRLRNRLKKYYETNPNPAGLRIDLPRGGYVPAIVGPEPVETPPPPLQPESAPTLPVPEQRPRPSVTPQVIGGAIAALAILLVAIWLIQRRSTAPAPFGSFARITSEQALCAYPTLSPDAQTLVYARRDRDQWDLYTRRIGTEEVRNLTPGSAVDDTQPAYSPDGKSVAFRSERQGGGIFLLNMATGAVRRLTSSGYHPSWSPDGRTILYSSETFYDPAEGPSDRSSALQMVDVQSASVTPLITSTDALQPVWSPSGKRVAFWGADRDGNRDIWTAPVEKDAKAIPVTRDVWTDWSPAWSPDGAYLYFSSDRGGAMNLWRIRIDQESGRPEAEPEPVTTPASYSGWGVFSRDGQSFVYGRRLVSSKLYRTGFDPSTGTASPERIALTAGARRVREPALSPVGDEMLVRVQDPQEDLALIRPDGTEIKRLTNDAYADRTARWSPDGKRIVFRSNRSGRFELWSMLADGTGSRQLTTVGSVYALFTPDGKLTGYSDRGPFVLDPPGGKPSNWGFAPEFRPLSWSPDQSYVAGRMPSRRGSGIALFVCRTGSQDCWELSPAVTNPSITWLKDNQRLLFSARSGVSIADVTARTTRIVLSEVNGDVHSRFVLSHDEKSLYFVISEDEEDIWMAKR